MKTRCRQPSRQGRRCGGRDRPSGLRVVGTSAIFRPISVALMTISEANSMPVVRRSILAVRPARVAAHPAVEIAGRAAEEQAADPGQDGVADVPVLPGHRAALDAPAEPVAHDQIVPGAELLQERHQAREVVAVIRVADDDVPSPRGQRRVVQAPHHTRGS